MSGDRPRAYEAVVGRGSPVLGRGVFTCVIASSKSSSPTGGGELPRATRELGAVSSRSYLARGN